MRQVEEMEQKEKAVKAGPCSTQHQGRGGRGNEKVGDKRRVHDARDAGGEGTGQGLRGEGGGAGGEKLGKQEKERGQAQAWQLRRQRQGGGYGEEKASLIRGRQRGPKAVA